VKYRRPECTIGGGFKGVIPVRTRANGRSECLFSPSVERGGGRCVSRINEGKDKKTKGRYKSDE